MTESIEIFQSKYKVMLNFFMHWIEALHDSQDVANIRVHDLLFKYFLALNIFYDGSV